MYERRSAPMSAGSPHHDVLETVTLEGYRQRHAQYKSDADLQAAHAMAPWLVVWDDHEVDNNCADDVEDRSPAR